MAYIEIDGKKYNFDKAFVRELTRVETDPITGEKKAVTEIGEWDFTQCIEQGNSVLLIDPAVGYEDLTVEQIKDILTKTESPKEFSYRALPKSDFEKYLIED